MDGKYELSKVLFDCKFIPLMFIFLVFLLIVFYPGYRYFYNLESKGPIGTAPEATLVCLIMMSAFFSLASAWSFSIELCSDGESPTLWYSLRGKESLAWSDLVLFYFKILSLLFKDYYFLAFSICSIVSSYDLWRIRLPLYILIMVAV